jgi:FkbM family methyltransferase
MQNVIKFFDTIIGKQSQRHSAGSYQIAKTKYGHMLTSSSDLVIGQMIRDKGAFGEGDIDAALKFLEPLGKPASRKLFLDVGANIGTHAIHALKTNFERAICVEAEPNNFRLLKINQILNDVEDRCSNVCAAASDSRGELTFQLSPINHGDHRIVGNNAGAKELHGESGWKTQTVKSDTLDNLIKSTGHKFSDIGLGWIDTQGHEGKVLSGAKHFLKAQVPFVAEFWPYGLERSKGWPAFRAALAGSKRKIYDLRASTKINQLVQKSISELDADYAEMTKAEHDKHTPHTDLLVV